MLFPWIKRPDLIAVPHDSGGWVVKDPLTLKYSYLNDTEYSILNFLDGRVSLNRLLKLVHDLDPTDQLTPDDLGAFVQSLAGHQLIRQIGSGDSLRLSQKQTVPTWQRLTMHLLQLLRVQFPLVNPSGFLSAAMPTVSRIAQPAVIRTLWIVFLAALGLVVLHLRELSDALPTIQEFLGPQNVVQMLLIFAFVKVLHEAGHAFTARYFGAECNECGVMLMMFTPVLYTNVTDSWMLPRRERILITAAGIAVELLIAATCTLLWWQASPGVVKSLLLNTMLLCSVNTILFNGNPLLRFDGYFLLADLLRIPNLASRSAVAVQQAILGFFSGHRSESADLFETNRTKIVLYVYGVLSMAYRVFLTLAILQLVRHMTKQWNVQIVGALLTVTILTGFVGIPLLRFLNRLFDLNAMAEYDSKSWMRIGIAASLLVVVLLIPFPQSVVAPAYVQCAAERIYANPGGQLVPTVRYGEAVSTGDVLAILRNPEIERTGLRLAGRVNELQKQLDSLMANSATANSDLIPTLNESLKSASEQLRKFEQESEKLHVSCAASGLFLPPPAVDREVQSDLREFWNGTAVSYHNTGAWISRGTLLGFVGLESDVELLVCVSQDDVDRVRIGQRAKYLASSGGADAIIGVVTEVATLESTVLPENLAVAGLVNGRPSADGVEPLEVTYVVTVTLSTGGEQLPPALYSVGHVRVDTEPNSLWRRFQRYLRQTF